MAEPIKITIKGSGTDGNDAPTVDDLLWQIQDFAAILKQVDSAISGNIDEQNIVWRVTNVTKNSPLSFELTPYPLNPQMNIDMRANSVVVATSNALNSIQTKAERPRYANDKVLNRVEKLFNRVANGLDETTIDFGNYKEVGPVGNPKRVRPVALRRREAVKTVERIHAIKKPKDLPYRELGSVEGTITRIERDGMGRSIVWLKTRLDGDNVKCVAAGNAANKIGHVEVERVWEGLRVRITGIISYKGLGKLHEVSADNVQFFKDDGELPSIDDIIDPNFTNGVESVTFLRKLRQDA